MSTKQQISDNIDSRLASSSNITAVRHRAAVKDDADSLLDEFYNITTITETQSSGTILSASFTGIEFVINIKKQGGVVFMNGTITNNTGSAVSDTDVVDIDASEYSPSADFNFIAHKTADAANFRMRVFNNIRTGEDLLDGEQVFFNLTYFIGQ